jgi:hypothetical protein
MERPYRVSLMRTYVRTARGSESTARNMTRTSALSVTNGSKVNAAIQTVSIVAEGRANLRCCWPDNNGMQRIGEIGRFASR